MSVPRPVLSVRDLAVSFEGPGGVHRAVDGLSLSVHAGQTLAVVGESGSGKSLTALSILRLLPKGARLDRGSITLADGAGGGGGEVELLGLGEAQMRRIRGGRIAMIFQEPMTSLNPVYTVGQQLSEAVRTHQGMSRQDARRASIAAMNEVGIERASARIDDYPHQFSGGMRQRIMIAMALACRPALLLADEPTTALDVTVQAQILELIRSLQQQHGLAVVLITHSLALVARHADVACVVYRGRVVEFGGVSAVIDRPMHPYTRALLACSPDAGPPAPRLTTVDQVVNDVSQFTPLPGQFRGLRPWWPTHRPPDDLAARMAAGGEYVLAEVEPRHWVGVWRTSAVADIEPTMPGVPVPAPAAAGANA